MPLCPRCDAPLDAHAICGWITAATLKEIGELQTLLAREGFELHIATAPVTVIEEER